MLLCSDARGQNVVKNVVCRGRVMLADCFCRSDGSTASASDPSSSFSKFCIVACHGSHDDPELRSDLGDVACLTGVRRRRRLPVCLVGDFNVDFSSTVPSSSISRRRRILESFIHARSLTVTVPISSFFAPAPACLPACRCCFNHFVPVPICHGLSDPTDLLLRQRVCGRCERVVLSIFENGAAARVAVPEWLIHSQDHDLVQSYVACVTRSWHFYW